MSVLRRWLESLLPDCPARDDVTLVATELGGNAVRYTASGRGGWFAVEITCHQRAVRVTVADCGAPDGPRAVEDPAGESGRGLQVVQGLSVRTGVCGDHRGRLAWADIPWDAAGDAGPACPAWPPGYQAAIGAGLAGLASRFAGVPAWFGRSTLQWWALAGGELVAAPSAQELASTLGRVLDPPRPRPAAATDGAFADARTAQAAGRAQRSGVRLPWQSPARDRLAGGQREETRPRGHGGPRTLRQPRPGLRVQQAALAAAGARTAQSPHTRLPVG